MGDGQISMLPGGVDQYLKHRRDTVLDVAQPVIAPPAPAKARAGSAEERGARKVMDRVERQLARISEREASLNAQIEAAGNDYTVLAGLSSELGDVAAERDMLELEWLEAAELLS
jgi:ATP-binding cassette subfamily F protein uup